jgi:hypothetical protein
VDNSPSPPPAPIGRYKDQNGDMIRDFKLIRSHYFRQSFPIDAAATLPLVVTIFELCTRDSSEDRTSTGKSGGDVLGLVSLLKCIRLFRLSRLIKFLQRFKIGNVLKLVQLLMIFVLTAHWMACIAVWFSDLTADPEEPGWFDPLKEDVWSRQYVTALYFMTTTLTTTGYGDISAKTPKEKGFFVMVMVIGSILYATILGEICCLQTAPRPRNIHPRYIIFPILSWLAASSNNVIAILLPIYICI